MKETTQNNILLAKFLGWKEQTDPTERWFGAFRTPEHIVHKNTNVEPLLFHCDWNWVMLALQKCDAVAYELGVHDDWIERFQTSLSQYEILDVYDVCIEFVKWYNENKQQ